MDLRLTGYVTTSRYEAASKLKNHSKRKLFKKVILILISNENLKFSWFFFMKEQIVDSELSMLSMVQITSVRTKFQFSNYSNLK